MKVFIKTYGCTLNQADSDIMVGELNKKGHRIVSENEADVIILNTCTVKGTTEHKILARLNKLKDKKVVVAGCLTVNQGKIEQVLPNAPLVSARSVDKINDAVELAIKGEKQVFRKPVSKENLIRIITSPILRIGISEGCVSSCSFCQTKLARPGLSSLSPRKIVDTINEGVESGAVEIQLTSMDSGAYGKDLRINLIDLLKTINEKVNDKVMIRLGMINPDHVKRMLKEMIYELKGEMFYKFLHVPVQTGSEKVCKDMNRDHSVKDYYEIVEYVRKQIPNMTISTDIIVGYPTETEDDFKKTVELIKKTKPEVVNISKFTPRPGTKAKKLKQLSTKVIKQRSRKVSELVHEILNEADSKYVGKTVEVVVTEKGKARMKNYKQVVVDSKNIVGSRIKVKIKSFRNGSLFAF